MRWGSLALVCGLAACSLDTSGLGGGTGGGGSTSAESGTDETTLAPTSSPPTTDGSGPGTGFPGTTTDDESTSTGSTGEPDTTDTTGSTGDLPSGAQSCAQLHDEDPGLGNGVYTFDFGDEQIDLYCLMDEFGGGWTLIARSEPDFQDSVPFGWNQQTGGVTNFTAPYSAGIFGLSVEFSQLLVADRTNGNVPANNAFILDLPSDFEDAYAATASEPNPPQRVLGSCPEGDIPIILERVGHTDLDNRFYFRDLVEPNQQGLHPNGFNLWYSDCERGGGMHEEQGLLFVR